MRILHTSDWHLGRTLHGVDLHDAQRAYLEHLVAVVVEKHVDVVIVAGDVYDRPIPSLATVALLSEALGRLSDLATVIVTPGNHDSAVRLGFAARLMRPGLHIVAGLDEILQPIVVSDDTGPVAFYGVPYLDPDQVRGVLGPILGLASPTPGAAELDERPAPLARSHEAVLGAALDAIRTDLSRRDGHRSVVIAHAFVVGGATSESERDIRVGGVDSVPSEVFAGIDYVALGHLHGAQTVTTARGAIRYSGSGLAFSFSEKNQTKSSTLVDLDAAGAVSIQVIPTPVPRPLAEFSGPLAELLSGRFDEHADSWLRVLVTDAARPERLHERVRERFPHALVVLHTPDGVTTDSRRAVITAETDPLDVAADFIAYATNTAPTDAEAAELRSAYEAAVAAERSA